MSHRAKLGLGTVQWGMPYGIANQNGQPTFAEVGSMLRTAKDRGITLLDTAYTYGEAEKVLGEQGAVLQDFRMVTKTLPLQSKTINEYKAASVSAAFLESLQRLQCPRVYGLLVHRADNLLVAGSDRLWTVLQDFKAQGRVEKIGVSVYHPNQLEKILDRYPIDLVQLPFNLYDQRFVRAGLLGRLKKAGVEIHARSAFLQGLLLLPPAQLPEHFRVIRNHHAGLHRQIGEAGLTPLEACLRFCLGQADIDQVIVGCESGVQLDEILAAAGKDDVLLSGPELYTINDESIINPSLWPK